MTDNERNDEGETEKARRSQENLGEHAASPTVPDVAAEQNRRRQGTEARTRRRLVVIPEGCDTADIVVDERRVHLTNLTKTFWSEIDLTKRDLLQYYAMVAPSLLPHIAGKPAVMKRYPNGAAGDYFFMKRAPAGRPSWIRTCAVEHRSGNVIDFPIVDGAASLLWLINLGCIDLNPWYAACDDHRPSRVFAFRSRSARRAVFGRARSELDHQRRAGRSGHADLCKNLGKRRHARLRSDRTRSDAETGVVVRESDGQAARGRAPRRDDRRIHHRQTPGRPRAGGLQSESPGRDAGVSLFGSAHPVGQRFLRR